MTQEKHDRNLTFPKFDVVSDFSDHHFLRRDPPCWAGKSCLKAISKEWRILQESLPESIFVRVSETRSDLLRAAIIGAAGTPYHDGLFFFDIALTANYPNEPPKVCYLSHGYPVNPNPYSSGTVCLSLLNTWKGQPSDRWNPQMSTLLQVLLSLQSLVLNEEPYYNEPGNLVNQKLSEYYSQDVFLLTCRSTINLIRNPPRNFESLIQHHFRQRVNSILSACDAYANGRVTVGFYGCDGAAPPSFELRSHFRTNAKIVYAKLAFEFRWIKGKPKGIFWRMIDNMRDALGLKKNVSVGKGKF